MPSPLMLFYYTLVQQFSWYQLPSLQIPQIPTQPCSDLTSHSVPISASPARSLKGFLTVLPRQGGAHYVHTSMSSILARWLYDMVNLESEIPVKQFTHFGWCIAKNVVYCFRTEVPCSSLSVKHHFGGSSTPMGKWMKKGHTRCPIPWKFFYRSQILTWSYIGNRSAIEV